MTKNRRGPGARGRHLSDDDHSVWTHTARSVEPMRKGKPRVHPALGGAEAGLDDRLPPDFAAVERSAPRHASWIEHHPPKERPRPVEAKPHRPAQPAIQPFDAKKAKRLRSGRLDVEARIDLHGLRQVEAHAELRRFLTSCHGRGLKTVLVITGKGAPADAEAHAGHEWWNGTSERGVLKRNVPRWLAEPDLAAIVVSFTEAAIRHGGAGALYVHLRSARRIVHED